MLKSGVGACVAAMVSVALIVPTTIVSAGQAQAAGGLFTGDCAEALAGADKLAQGMKSLDDMIDRTQKQMDDARNAGGHMSREAARQAADARKDLMADTTVSVLSKIGEMKGALEKLARVVPRAKAVSVLKGLKDIKAIEDVYKGVKLTIASGKWSLAMEEANSGMDRVAALGRFLDDVGLTGELATVVGGAVGGLAVAVGVFAIDTVAADEDAFQNTLDQNRAANTLNLIRQNRGIYQDKISAVRLRCAPRQTSQAKSTPPSSPLPTPPPEAMVSAGPSIGKALAVTGVGAAGVAGAIIYGPQLFSGLGGGPDCTSQLAAISTAANGLSGCGTSTSCFNSVINRIISATVAVCTCVGSTPLDASEKAYVTDLFAQMRSLGQSPGSLPSCFR